MRNFRLMKSVWSFFFLIAVVLLSVKPVFSEGPISRIEITSIDPSQFPQVVLQARILDANQLPLENITPEIVRIREDGQPVDSTLNRAEAENFAAFVIDCGIGNNLKGGSGNTRIQEARSILRHYILAMRPNDQAAIIQQVEANTLVTQELTSDREKLLSAVDALKSSDGQRFSCGYSGIQKALEELEKAPNKSISKSILFLSPGAQNAAALTDARSVIDQAKELGYPINAVMLRDSNNFHMGMQDLAESTGGLYQFYKADTDIDNIIQWYTRQHTLYAFTFYSKSNSNSTRMVEITAAESGSQAPHGSIYYVVHPTAPQVVIENPAQNSTFMRSASTQDVDLKNVEPTSATVNAIVMWPDRYPRRIISARLLVDDTPVGTELVEPGDNLSFNWDLRTFTTPGESNAQLRVRAVDELGFEALSEPINVQVVVKVPPAPTISPVASECNNLTGILLVMCRSNSFAGWVALALILPTLLLALLTYLRREKIVMASQRTVDFADAAWKRITQGPKDMKAVATLQVLSEAHKSILGSSIPLYRGEPISMGRDPTTNRIPILEPRQDTVISREHCVIIERDSNWYIKDLGSTYGTMLNGKQIPQMTEVILEDGDDISLGPVAYGGLGLRFSLAAPEDTTSSKSRSTWWDVE